MEEKSGARREIETAEHDTFRKGRSPCLRRPTRDLLVESQRDCLGAGRPIGQRNRRAPTAAIGKLRDDLHLRG